MVKRVRRIVLVGLLAFNNSIVLGYTLPEPPKTKLTEKYATELSYFNVPPDALPDNCSLVREIVTAPIMPITSNPYITDDASIIKLMLSQSKRTVMPDVVLMSLYSDGILGREVGMWGYYFSSAKEAKKGLKQGSLIKQSLVIWIWADSENSEPCLQAIKNHLIKKGFEVNKSVSN